MSLAEVLKIIVLRIVEGFTEWLPISNADHMVLVDGITHLNQPDMFKDVFLVVIQLGTILTVVIMFSHKLNPLSLSKSSRQGDAIWAPWIKIIIICVPAVILGPLLGDQVEAHLSNAYVVAAALIIYGILFIVFENSSVYTNPRFSKVEQTSVKTTFLIGMIQLLVLTPGTSRSGSTILGTMIPGCSEIAAAEFSFFLGTPVMFGANLLKIVKYSLAGNVFMGPQIFYTILGMLVAFVASTYSIQFPTSYVRKHDFKFFGYYRIILGVIVPAYFGITVLASQG